MEDIDVHFENLRRALCDLLSSVDERVVPDVELNFTREFLQQREFGLVVEDLERFKASYGVLLDDAKLCAAKELIEKFGKPGVKYKL